MKYRSFVWFIGGYDSCILEFQNDNAIRIAKRLRLESMTQAAAGWAAWDGLDFGPAVLTTAVSTWAGAKTRRRWEVWSMRLGMPLAWIMSKSVVMRRRSSRGMAHIWSCTGGILMPVGRVSTYLTSRPTLALRTKAGADEPCFGGDLRRFWVSWGQFCGMFLPTFWCLLPGARRRRCILRLFTLWLWQYHALWARWCIWHKPARAGESHGQPQAFDDWRYRADFGCIPVRWDSSPLAENCWWSFSQVR